MNKNNIRAKPKQLTEKRVREIVREEIKKESIRQAKISLKFHSVA
jgi:hypothetical protein